MHNSQTENRVFVSIEWMMFQKHNKMPITIANVLISAVMKSMARE